MNTPLRNDAQTVVVNQSQCIRNAFTELGKETSTKDIIKYIRQTHGVTVKEALVHSVKKSAGLSKSYKKRTGPTSKLATAAFTLLETFDLAAAQRYIENVANPLKDKNGNIVWN